MESKCARVEGHGGAGDLVERLPQAVLIEILSRLDLDSLCSAAPVCRALRSSVSQTLALILSLDLSGFSPSTNILNSVIRDNRILRSLTLDCSRLNDTSIQYFLKEHLQELVLFKCSHFSSHIFTAIGERCPELRLLTLEVVNHSELESPDACKEALDLMAKGCLHLESLCIKFPDQYTSPGDYEFTGIVLPNNIKSLILQPISIRQAMVLIPMGSMLRSLSLVLTEITDILLAWIAFKLPVLAELCLEDRPLQEPPMHRDLTNTGLQLLGLCRNLTVLSLTRSKENCTATFRRVNDVGMLLLAERCKGLESVRLAGFSKVTDAGYASIFHSCVNLKRFEIVNAPFLSDLAFPDDCNASSSLIDVRLISCKLLTSDTVKSLSLCQNLEVIDLSGCRSISNAGLIALKDLRKLTTLDLAGADITDNGLSSLGMGNSPIASLCLRGCKRITDRGLSLLLHGNGVISRTLTKLDLGYLPGISDRGITTIAELCSQLADLCVRHCFFISDASLKTLGSLAGLQGDRRQIRKLDLYNCCGLSILSFDLLARPYFLRLRWLGVGNTRLSGRGKEKLVELSRARPGLSVCLSGCEMGCNVGWSFHECM
ncbi:F-box protein At-B [Iris pallida]|uniref:F-box protein At-B n=1 Tax=Iris pallida TaxID=29817 RepID=A0AAX6GJ01_IRIPA|nr:F-box protein At-B [Iris pallida]